VLLKLNCITVDHNIPSHPAGYLTIVVRFSRFSTARVLHALCDGVYDSGEREPACLGLRVPPRALRQQRHKLRGVHAGRRLRLGWCVGSGREHIEVSGRNADIILSSLSERG
jgi:hypothetical protein